MNPQDLNHWRNWLAQTDPQEWTNFAERHAAELAAVQTAWAHYQTETGSLKADGQPESRAADTAPTPSDDTGSLKTEAAPENTPSAAAPQTQPEAEAETQDKTPAPPQTPPEPETTPPADSGSLKADPMPAPRILPPLPNARAGEAYRAPLPPSAANVTISPAACGLVWNEADHSISGTPAAAGDVEIRYTVPEHGAHTPVRQTLYINPDPKSLWQDKPSDPAAPYAKPDRAGEIQTTPSGTLIAARVRGRSHAHNGTHCDDDYTIRHHPRTNLHFLAVSDGAGSAQYSRHGSRLAVQAAADTVWQLLDDPAQDFFRLPDYDTANQKRVLSALIRHAAYQAYAAQVEAARTESIPLKSLSATLLITLILPTAGKWLVAAYWVGDGAAAVWQPESRTACLLGSPDGGAYSGETVFLAAAEVSGEKLDQRTKTGESPIPPVLILMTDGVSDPKFETDAGLTDNARWNALWTELQAPLSAPDPAAALQNWLDFWSPGNHDDRTVALFVPNQNKAA